MPIENFLNVEHEIFENAMTEAMHSIHSEMPQANDRAMVRKIASEWLMKNIQLGERDRSKLAQGAIAHVRQVLQLEK
jgi:hypothetical protein